MSEKPFAELPDLRTISDAAKILHVSLRSVYRLAESGNLPTVRIGGRILVFGHEIADYITRNTRRAEGSQAAEG